MHFCTHALMHARLCALCMALSSCLHTTAMLCMSATLHALHGCLGGMGVQLITCMHHITALTLVDCVRSGWLALAMSACKHHLCIAAVHGIADKPGWTHVLQISRRVVPESSQGTHQDQQVRFCVQTFGWLPQYPDVTSGLAYGKIFHKDGASKSYTHTHTHTHTCKSTQNWNAAWICRQPFHAPCACVCVCSQVSLV